MVNRSQDILVGAFVLVLGAAFVWGVLWISAGGPPQRYDHYVTFMTESVSGLYVDAPLNFQGVDVGKVERIDIDPKNPQRVRLLLQVQQGTPVNQGTVAIMEYQGLTGIANVNLIGAAKELPPIAPLPGEEFPIIPSRTSLYVRLEQTVADLTDNLSATAKLVNAFLSGSNREHLEATIANMALISDNVAAQSARLDTLVTRMDGILANVQVGSSRLPALLEDFAGTASAVNDMATSIHVVSRNLEHASLDITKSLSETGNGVANFASEALPELSALLAELRITSENLRRVSEILAENPNALVFGTEKPKRGPGE